MEKLISIATFDGRRMYGKLQYRGAKPKRIVIFVHGMTGHSNEHQFLNGSTFFLKRGYATLRCDLYSGLKKGRYFTECTVKIHGKDVTSMVSYAKKSGFKEIFLVGHSLGCPSILLSETKHVQGIVFWDPSIDVHRWPTDFSEAFYYDKKLDAPVVSWGVKYVIGPKMWAEIAAFPDCRKLVQKHNVPIKFIAAEKGVLVKGTKAYFKAANLPKSMSVIPGATHCFDEEGAEEKLFRETFEWIKRCGRKTMRF